MSQSEMTKRTAISYQAREKDTTEAKRLNSIMGRITTKPGSKYNPSPLSSISSASDQLEAVDLSSADARSPKARFSEQESGDSQQLFGEMELDSSDLKAEESWPSATATTVTSEFVIPEHPWAYMSGGDTWSDLVEDELRENQEQQGTPGSDVIRMDIASTDSTSAVKAVSEPTAASLSATSLFTFDESDESSGCNASETGSPSSNYEWTCDDFDDVVMSGITSEEATTEPQPEPITLTYAYDHQNFLNFRLPEVQVRVHEMFNEGLTFKEVKDRILEEGYSNDMFDDDGSQVFLMPTLLTLKPDTTKIRRRTPPPITASRPVATEVSPAARKAEFEMFLRAFDQRRQLDAAEESFSQTQEMFEVE